MAATASAASRSSPRRAILPGHVSFLDTRDRTVIVGDVFTSVGGLAVSNHFYCPSRSRRSPLGTRPRISSRRRRSGRSSRACSWSDTAARSATRSRRWTRRSPRAAAEPNRDLGLHQGRARRRRRHGCGRGAARDPRRRRAARGDHAHSWPRRGAGAGVPVRRGADRRAAGGRPDRGLRGQHDRGAGPLPREPGARRFYTTSSCGVCGKGALEEVAVHERTTAVGPGGRPQRSWPGCPTASSSPASSSPAACTPPASSTPTATLLITREDVGRHNAMDKVIGRALLDGLVPLGERILCVSGRLSFELVQKAAVAGAPILVGVGAPSSLAVALADERGMTLCGFARRGRVNVYTHPERSRRLTRRLRDATPPRASRRPAARRPPREFHAPTRRAPAAVGGMLRTITPLRRQPRRPSAAASAPPRTTQRRARRAGHRRTRARSTLGQPRRERRPRARAPNPIRPPRSTSSDASAKALRIPAGKPWSKRADALGR